MMLSPRAARAWASATLLVAALARAGVPAAAPPDDATRRRAAKGQIAQMIARLQAVSHRLQEARGERDVIKVNYIGTKMAAIEGLVRVAIDAASALDDALAGHDGQAAGHAEQKLGIAGEKVQRLAAESATAVGETAIYAGATDVQFAYDPALAGPAAQRPETLLEALVRDVNLAQRPPAASPYQ